MARRLDRPGILGSLLASTLLAGVLGLGCGGDDDEVLPGTREPEPVAFESVAPPPHGLTPIVRAVWTRGDTVVINRYVSFDRRATWRAIELVPEGRLPADFVFLSDTTGVVRTGLNAFTLADLEAGTFRNLSGERDDLSGWAVHDGFLYHFVEEITEGGSISDERSVGYFFRLDLSDPDAEWETLPTLATTYEPLRFRASLHSTDAGLVVVTRFGFHTSVDGGQTWSEGPAVPMGLGGALGDLNPVWITRAGNVLIVQGPNTVASYDGGATYETIGPNPGSDVDWMDFEILPDGTLTFPKSRLRSDDDGRTWRSFLDAEIPRTRAYLRGDEVYLSDETRGPTLVVREDGEVEMLLARVSNEAGGGLLRAVPLASGELVAVVGNDQLRFRPGQRAWTWERELPGAVDLFDVGAGRLAYATTVAGDRTPSLVFSEDGGATWGEPVLLSGDASVERLVALPDRLLAYMREGCTGTLLESVDDGATWSRLPPGGALVDSEGAVVVDGFLDHVPVAATSDGVIFGHSTSYFPIGSDCNTIDTYPSRSDDAGRTWVQIGGGTTAEVAYLPIATTSRDDLVAAGFVASDLPSGMTRTVLDVWLFRRAAERWAAIGVPTADDEPVPAAPVFDVRAHVDPTDRLMLTVFGLGIVRSAEPLR
jgi:hypothetical protein